MFPNLRGEMAKKGVTIKDLSELTGISYNTLYPKLRGEKPLKLTDAILIHRVLETDLKIEQLFEGIFK